MSDLARAGVDQVIALVDTVIDSAVAAVDATQNAAFETVGQAVSIGDKTADAAMAEIKTAKARLMTLLKAYADAVTSAVPLP